MELFIEESHQQVQEFFQDLESRFKEAAQHCSRQYEKKLKQQDDELRQLKEKLTKKDEILKFHEEEINALRNQVKSLKTERPLCPSCSQREEVDNPSIKKTEIGPVSGRKRIFSPDSSCVDSVDSVVLTNDKNKNKQSKFNGKRRRTGPDKLLADSADEITPTENADPMDKAFLLDKTPDQFRANFQAVDKTDQPKVQRTEKNSQPQVAKIEVKDTSVLFQVNELSPPSMLSTDAGRTAKNIGPELGLSFVQPDRDSVLDESPPLVPIRGAALATRRSYSNRLGTKSSRQARQMKLHTLTFAPKGHLTSLMQKTKKTLSNFQDLEETVLETPEIKMETRLSSKLKNSNDADLPFVGGSPTDVKVFKKPKLPKPSGPSLSSAGVNSHSSKSSKNDAHSPEKMRKDSQMSGSEFTPIDPIACSTLKVGSDSSSFLHVTSEISDQTDSVVFGPPAPQRRPLSPKNEPKTQNVEKNDGIDVKHYDAEEPKRDQFKYVPEVERRKAERRNLEGFSCYECYEYYRDSNLTEKEIEEKIRHCSRHRAKHAPPSTPEGFWDIDLPLTQEKKHSPNEVQRKRRKKPYQFPKK